MMSALYNNTYQFIQTEQYVVILVEMAHDARIIPSMRHQQKLALTAGLTPMNRGLGIL